MAIRPFGRSPPERLPEPFAEPMDAGALRLTRTQSAGERGVRDCPALSVSRDSGPRSRRLCRLVAFAPSRPSAVQQRHRPLAVVMASGVIPMPYQTGGGPPPPGIEGQDRNTAATFLGIRRSHSLLRNRSERSAERSKAPPGPVRIGDPVVRQQPREKLLVKSWASAEE